MSPLDNYLIGDVDARGSPSRSEDVCFGSIASILAFLRDFRSTPDNDRIADVAGCLNVPLASFGNAANSMLSGTSIDDVIGNDLSVEAK